MQYCTKPGRNFLPKVSTVMCRPYVHQLGHILNTRSFQKTPRVEYYQLKRPLFIQKCHSLLFSVPLCCPNPFSLNLSKITALFGKLSTAPCCIHLFRYFKLIKQGILTKLFKGCIFRIHISYAALVVFAVIKCCLIEYCFRVVFSAMTEF